VEALIAYGRVHHRIWCKRIHIHQLSGLQSLMTSPNHIANLITIKLDQYVAF